MKAVYRWAGFSLVVLASGFFIVYVVDNWSNLPSRILERPVLATLTVAPFGYLAGFLLTAIAWRILLGAMGETPRLTQALSILLISQIAKYLPGNFGHHVGRVLMARNAGLASGLVVLATTLEAGGVMLAAVCVGFLALMVDSTALLGGVVEIPGPVELLDLPSIGR